MQTIMYYFSSVAVFSVLAVLVMGLWVMSRGESPNLSQKLMRWRVGLQFAAIVAIIVFILIKQGT